MKKLLLIPLTALTVAGCTASVSSTPIEPSQPPSAVAAPTTAPGALTAQDVAEAFAEEGLPATRPRDNTGANCLDLGCAQLITTDDVSIYQFADLAAAKKMANVFDDGAHRDKLIVLQYVGARTSKADQKRYEKVLARLQR